MSLPTDSKERKKIPLTTGVIDYFPLALVEVAKVSLAGNEQHNPGEPLHWARGKSMDHADCITRHLIDRGKRDADGQLHSAKLAWRALALLQIELEEAQAKEQRRTEHRQSIERLESGLYSVPFHYPVGPPPDWATGPSEQEKDRG